MRSSIARGASSGVLAYVGKTESADYDPFVYGKSLSANDVELSADVYIVTKETADAYLAAKAAPPVTSAPADGGKAQPPTTPTTGTGTPPAATGGTTAQPPDTGTLFPPETPSSACSKLTWTGSVPAQKWMNFYVKVLSKFASGKGLKLTVTVEAAPEGGISTQKLEETKAALRELGLDDEVQTA